LVLAGLLLGLVAGEIAVRLFDLGPRFQVVFSENYEISDNATLGYVLKPGSVKGLYRINSGGFRDREFSEEKPPGVFRIVVVGDSVTFGLLCDAGSAYPKQLEALLTEHATGGAPRFEVLNLGVTGYNISQVVEFLRVVGTRYEPDLIVYGYLLNDPQRFSQEGEALLELRRSAEQRFLGQSARGIARMLSRSRLFLLARHVATRPPPARETFPEHVDPQDTAILEDPRGAYFRKLHTDSEPRSRFVEGLADLARLSGRQGVPAVVAVLPMFLTRDGGRYPLGDVHALVVAEASTKGLVAFDLQPAFDVVGTRYSERPNLDFLHPTPFGQRIVALALLHELDASGLLPEGSVDYGALAAGTDSDAVIARMLAD